MKITQKQILWLLVAVALIVGGYFAYREFSWLLKKRQIIPPAPSGNDDQSTNGGSSTKYNKGDNFPLEKFSNGTRVLELQKAMNAAIDRFKLTANKISADGKLGPDTIDLMSKFKIELPLSQTHYNNAVSVLKGMIGITPLQVQIPYN